MSELEFEVLYAVICEVESGGNPRSFRFEPRFAERIEDKDKALRRAGMMINAERNSLRTYLATSVCRIQILIYNLFFYDSLFTLITDRIGIPTIPWILEPETEKKVLRYFLEAKGIYFYPFKRASLLEEFAIKYNGSREYADRLWETFRGVCS